MVAELRMDLHDFLANSLELLALLESIEQCHIAVSEDIARLHALPAGDRRLSTLLAELRAAHRDAESAIDHAIGLISSF